VAKVLILEDDVEFASLLVDSLLQDGHQAEFYTTATDALAALANTDFDIVVADVFIKVDGGYAGEGGISLVSQIKQIQRSRIPVIAISGSFSNENTSGPMISTLQTVGANAVLAKPFDPQQLLDLIFDLVNRRF
jgi:CheY-like chemotaxis protein